MADLRPCPRCARPSPRMPLPSEWGEDIAQKWREMEDSMFLCSHCAREIDRFVAAEFGSSEPLSHRPRKMGAPREAGAPHAKVRDQLPKDQG